MSEFVPKKALPYTDDGRLYASFNHHITMFNAAKTSAARVLPDGNAVGRTAKVINGLRPHVEEYQLRDDNITKEHTPTDDATVSEGSRVAYKNPLLMATKKADEGRKIVHEDESAGLFGVPCPPILKRADLPKAKEGTKNDEGVALIQSELLCLYSEE